MKLVSAIAALAFLAVSSPAFAQGTSGAGDQAQGETRKDKRQDKKEDRKENKTDRKEDRQENRADRKEDKAERKADRKE
jgi:uncharacterized membrane protein